MSHKKIILYNTKKRKKEKKEMTYYMPPNYFVHDDVRRIHLCQKYGIPFRCQRGLFRIESMQTLSQDQPDDFIEAFADRLFTNKEEALEYDYIETEIEINYKWVENDDDTVYAARVEPYKKKCYRKKCVLSKKTEYFELETKDVFDLLFNKFIVSDVEWNVYNHQIEEADRMRYRICFSDGEHDDY